MQDSQSISSPLVEVCCIWGDVRVWLPNLSVTKVCPLGAATGTLGPIPERKSCFHFGSELKSYCRLQIWLKFLIWLETTWKAFLRIPEKSTIPESAIVSGSGQRAVREVRQSRPGRWCRNSPPGDLMWDGLVFGDTKIVSVAKSILSKSIPKHTWVFQKIGVPPNHPF